MPWSEVQVPLCRHRGVMEGCGGERSELHFRRVPLSQMDLGWRGWCQRQVRGSNGPDPHWESGVWREGTGGGGALAVD